MPKIDPRKAPFRVGSNYPAPLDEPCKTRTVISLGDAGGLTQFGAQLVTLPPGVWASQRHHHSGEDEFIYILSGHPTFIDDDGDIDLVPGDATAHPAGDGNGHHMINRTDKDVTFLVVGSRRPQTDHVRYSDVDLDLPANGTPLRVPHRKDGTPYEAGPTKPVPGSGT